MSFLTTHPEMLASAAGDLQNIGAAVAAGNVAAAAPTTGVVPAAADEVSALTAAQFAIHAAQYQALSAQAVAIHEAFVQTLGTSAGSYGATEAANAVAARAEGFSMDFGGLPPEINSARMYAGPGSGPMLASAAAWASLGAELNSAASSYGSVILALTSGPWVGPSSMAMAAAVAPYVEWMSATGDQAELRPPMPMRQPARMRRRSR